jgi:ribonuclease HI
MKQKPINITINTDASWHPEYKVGGYAFWIVCDKFKITKSGKFKTNPKSSTEAEIMAIGNAIHALLSINEPLECSLLVINTDSKQAISRIKSGVCEYGKMVRSIHLKLLSKINARKNKFRHVKAHSGKDDSRSFVNEWCDTEAKKWMRLQVTYIKQAQLTKEIFDR